MAQPYVGEIRMFAGSFAPVGWMFCEGQILSISENDTLFNLIGTTYGGNGQETFGLPDLRGRVPIHQGTAASSTTYTIGQNGGVENVTLMVNQIPPHNHAMIGQPKRGNTNNPKDALWAKSTLNQFASSPSSLQQMHTGIIAPAGGQSTA